MARYRGRNLGRAITARMIEATLLGLGATSVYGPVSETNTASRRMLES